MAGKPFRSVIKPLEALAEADELSGPDFVRQWIANGDTVSGLAARLGVSRQQVSTALNKFPEYHSALEQGRREAADALVEESKDLIDAVALEARTHDGARFSDIVRSVEMQANQRRFMAGAYNQDRYGNKQNSVTINVGDLHLEALRKMRDVTPVDVTPTPGVLLHDE